MARIVTPNEPRYRPLRHQGDSPDFDRDLKRIGTGQQDAPAPMRPYTAQSFVDQRTRYSNHAYDSLIRRDGVPQYLVQNYQPAGAQVNNWTAAGPARPTLWTMRMQTITPRSGGKVRWLQNPAAPGTGLHTEVNNDASGAVGSAGRYSDDNVPQMRVRRQNRLSPAVYTGQSYSQITKIQGAR